MEIIGTSTRYLESIESNGLNPALFTLTRSNIFYSGFSVSEAIFSGGISVNHLPSHLLYIIGIGAGIAINRSRRSDQHGGEGTSPLLVVFHDPDDRGRFSTVDSYPTKIIPNVSPEDLLGLYTLSPDEYRVNQGREYFIHPRFVTRVIKDIACKLGV